MVLEIISYTSLDKLASAKIRFSSGWANFWYVEFKLFTILNPCATRLATPELNLSIRKTSSAIKR